MKYNATKSILTAALFALSLNLTSCGDGEKKEEPAATEQAATPTAEPAPAASSAPAVEPMDTANPRPTKPVGGGN